MAKPEFPEKRETYRVLWKDDVEFIEKEAFNDMRSAAESMADQLRWFSMRAGGRDASAMKELCEKTLARYALTLDIWKTFLEQMGLR